MNGVGVSVALCALLVSHNGSQGKSRFDISNDGTVDIRKNVGTNATANSAW